MYLGRESIKEDYFLKRKKIVLVILNCIGIHNYRSCLWCFFVNTIRMNKGLMEEVFHELKNCSEALCLAGTCMQHLLTHCCNLTEILSQRSHFSFVNVVLLYPMEKVVLGFRYYMLITIGIYHEKTVEKCRILARVALSKHEGKA